MKILKEGCPSQDGFHMPAEYEPHKGTILIWPKRPGSWIYGAKKAREAFADVICAAAESETVYLLVEAGELDHAQMIIEAVRKEKNYQKNYPVHYMEIASDDAWARDVGPTFVVNGQGQVRGIDWCFNAWGGICDGLYADWEKDDKVASSFCRKTEYDLYDAHPFVLEGGAIHTDGEGTILVTESCLLSKGRNPKLSKEKIGQKLKDYLGAEKIIWIPYGIYNDETNGHIDNVCAFTSPGHVVLAWTEDSKDPQYPLSSADLAILEKETDARGRKLIVHKVPVPGKPVCITEYELAGFSFEEGEEQRKAGERLAASYVNFYITNGGVLIPQFEDEMDAEAVNIIGGLFPGRKVYPVYARDIIVGGGNIHCITQQIPADSGRMGGA